MQIAKNNVSDGTEFEPQSRGQFSDFSKIFALVQKIVSTAGDRDLGRDERDFSRDGPLSPGLLATLLLYMVADGNRRGYGLLLDKFWDEARGFGLPLPTREPVTAASFCVARHKISADHMRCLVHEAADAFEESFGDSMRWHGRRVFAVDGSKVNLQRSEDLHRAFGTPNDAYCPQALLSVLFDVCGKVAVDLHVSPYASSERGHLLAMMPQFSPGDLVVLDRGYPSHEVLQALTKEKIDFLVRVPSSNTFSVIDDIRWSPTDDRRATVEVPPGSPEDWESLNLRVLRLTNHNGEESFFLTTLSSTQFSLEDIRELYHMRWEVEEYYKLFKSSYAGQGQFRSKGPSGVRQEMHAQVLFFTISRFIMATAARDEGIDHNVIAQKSGVLAVADYITRLFLCHDIGHTTECLRALFVRISKRRKDQRPNRSHPRISCKPRLRWGPQGRVGA